MSRSRIRVPEPLRPLAVLAHRLGWRVTRARSGHLRWHAPDGTVVTTAATPSDSRGSRNARAQLRRAGLKEETS